MHCLFAVGRWTGMECPAACRCIDRTLARRSNDRLPFHLYFPLWLLRRLLVLWATLPFLIMCLRYPLPTVILHHIQFYVMSHKMPSIPPPSLGKVTFSLSLSLSSSNEEGFLWTSSPIISFSLSVQGGGGGRNVRFVCMYIYLYIGQPSLCTTRTTAQLETTQTNNMP